MCESEERRRAASEVGGSGAREAALGIPAAAVELEEKGMHVNHKRVYREAGLLIRRKRRRRLLRAGFVRPAVTGANQEWALDFVHDAAESGRKFRC